MTALGASTTQAALALTAFWAMVTVGRLLFAAIGRWMPPRTVFRVLPIVLVGTFALTAALSDAAPARGIVVFGLAGLGCSALLPLVISLGQGALPRVSAAVAGGVIAFYQVGLRHRSLRSRPPRRPRRAPVRPVRLDRGRSRRHGPAVVRDHPCQEGMTPLPPGAHRTIVGLSDTAGRGDRDAGEGRRSARRGGPHRGVGPPRGGDPRGARRGRRPAVPRALGRRARGADASQGRTHTARRRPEGRCAARRHRLSGTAQSPRVPAVDPA